MDGCVGGTGNEEMRGGGVSIRLRNMYQLHGILPVDFMSSWVFSYVFRKAFYLSKNNVYLWVALWKLNLPFCLISINFSLCRGRYSPDNHSGKYGWVEVQFLIRYLLKPAQHPLTQNLCIWNHNHPLVLEGWAEVVWCRLLLVGRPLLSEITLSLKVEALTPAIPVDLGPGRHLAASLYPLPSSGPC